MPEARLKDQPYREAIDFMRQKVRLPTRAWSDLREGQHARAFVVAGAMKAELIEDFHKAVSKALEQGTTLAEFRADFDRIVAAHGWSYKGGRGWRTRVIYNTNLRTAHAAGRWAQINRQVEIQRRRGRQVYLRYVAVMDSRTRPQHKAWHGIILPADHPFWRTHYPPNGWFCRCTVQILTDLDLARYGYAVTPDEALPEIHMEARAVRTADGREI
uniref:phage head morphogenesis protein n=1 Tax=Telmatospirillum sp. J64-1 TaxID=2502183 RepID=UPI00163D86D5